MSKTPNISLEVTAVTDTGKTFRDFRTELAGDGPGSNMSIIDKEIGAVKERCDVYDTTIDEINADIEGLNDTAAAAGADITELQGRADGHDTSISGLNDRLDGVDTDMDGMTEDIAALQERCADYDENAFTWGQLKNGMANGA